jgi:hypothetical protein
VIRVDGRGPAVTCLCPTYGRPQQLRDSVACFLLQDYHLKRLLILNDGPVPLSGAGLPSAVEVVNAGARYPTLGHKRQALLEMADTPLVAHWDDDDLYLPWHLSRCSRRLQETRASCVKAASAWYATGPRGRATVQGVRRNVFEGQMVFRRDRALSLGGYPPLDSGQAKELLEAFGRAGELHVWEPPEERISYIYRWADGLAHVSAGRQRGLVHCMASPAGTGPRPPAGPHPELTATAGAALVAHCRAGRTPEHPPGPYPGRRGVADGDTVGAPGPPSGRDLFVPVNRGVHDGH